VLTRGSPFAGASLCVDRNLAPPASIPCTCTNSKTTTITITLLRHSTSSLHNSLSTFHTPNSLSAVHPPSDRLPLPHPHAALSRFATTGQPERSTTTTRLLIPSVSVQHGERVSINCACRLLAAEALQTTCIPQTTLPHEANSLCAASPEPGAPFGTQ
jgi:hypothetical protein